MPSHTEPMSSEVAASSRFSTAAAELWISMVRKKSPAAFLSTWNRSCPWRMSSPVLATPITTGALTMLRAAMRSSVDDGRGKRAAASPTSWASSAFLPSARTTVKRQDC